MNPYNWNLAGKMNLKVILSLMAFGCLVGCLQQDPVGPKVEGPSTQDMEDPVLLAGASSSTNWPVKVQVGKPINLTGKADSILSFDFFQLNSSFLPEAYSATGSLTISPATAIPALHAVKSFTQSFSNSFQVTVQSDLLDSLPGKDSVYFTLLVEIDTLRRILVGFGYSKSKRQYFQSPFSATPIVPVQMEGRHYSFQGELDTSVLPQILPNYENSEMCFYIPGTTFHWKTRLANPLSIGPLPSGSYPLQLIVVRPTGSGGKTSQVEIYEVLLREESNKSWRFSIGQKLLAKNMPGQVSLVSDSQ